MRSLLLLAACVSCVSAARADEPNLVPRTLESGAYLELFGSHEQDTHDYLGKSFRWSDTFFKEKVTFFTHGYWYHPLFLQYKLILGGGFKQEDFSYSNGRSYRNNDSSLEYDVRLLFLPEHAYNLELFARRYEPLVKEAAAVRHNSVETNRGAMVRFRKNDFFFHARYTDDSFETGAATSYVTRFGVDAEYLKRYRSGNQLSFSAAFNPSDFSNTSGISGTTDDIVLGNLIDLRSVRLNSTVSKTTQDQRGGSLDSFESDHFVWWERLNVYLPWHLRSDVYYRYQDSERTIDERHDGTPEKLTDTSRDLQFHLIHRLYESLDTTYSYLHGTKDSSGGESTTVSNILTLNYTKAIHRGRIIVGTSFGRTDTDNLGRADVVDEPHAAVAVPGSFTLGQSHVTASTVAVFLKSPLPPFESIQLQENIHYNLVPTGDTFTVELLGLPPEFVLPGTYDFFVSYTLTTGEFSVRADTLGANASVELLDQFLTPYVSYVGVTNKVLAGEFPGVLLDSTTTAAGMIVRWGKFRAVGELNRVDWDVDPYHGYRAELQYVGSIGATSNLYLRGVYIDRNYTDGTPYSSLPHDDRTFSASGSVQKNFVEKRLVLSGGGGYSRYQGLVDSTSFFINASLTWKIGLLDLVSGANISMADSRGSTGVEMNREHQYYYVQLRRRLF